MSEKSGKKAKTKRKSGKNSVYSADSKKSVQEGKQFSEASGTLEVIPPKHGGQNKIEVTPHMIARAEKYAGIGLTNQQIGAALDMSKDTLRVRCLEIPELAQAIERGRAVGINNVATRLYVKATEEDNLMAQMFYLKTRAGWSEKKEIELSAPGGSPIELEQKWTIEIIPAKPEEEK